MPSHKPCIFLYKPISRYFNIYIHTMYPYTPHSNPNLLQVGKHTILGSTIDDSIGEAFDKTVLISEVYVILAPLIPHIHGINLFFGFRVHLCQSFVGILETLIMGGQIIGGGNCRSFSDFAVLRSEAGNKARLLGITKAAASAPSCQTFGGCMRDTP